MRRVFRITNQKNGRFSIQEKVFLFFWKYFQNQGITVTYVNRKTAESVIDDITKKSTTKNYTQPEIQYEVIIHDSAR